MKLHRETRHFLHPLATSSSPIASSDQNLPRETCDKLGTIRLGSVTAKDSKSPGTAHPGHPWPSNMWHVHNLIANLWSDHVLEPQGQVEGSWSCLFPHPPKRSKKSNQCCKLNSCSVPFLLKPCFCPIFLVQFRSVWRFVPTCENQLWLQGLEAWKYKQLWSMIYKNLQGSLKFSPQGTEILSVQPAKKRSALVQTLVVPTCKKKDWHR